MTRSSKNKIPLSFGSDIFINCPFDARYRRLFNAIVYTVHDMRFRSRCALEARNAGQIRLHKILDIIAECKYGIHDLSRTELDSASGLPRFNMPLELGLDLGCKRYGQPYQQEKVLLILDIEQHRYQKFISDIAGQDIACHSGRVRDVIDIVREWLRPELDPRVVIIPSGDEIWRRYQRFLRALPDICAARHWNRARLGFLDYSAAAAAWITANPL
jgi:hypothetical protein